MATVDKQGVVTMQELLVSSLATADALTKLPIEKGLITKDEFLEKLSAERAVYQGFWMEQPIPRRAEFWTKAPFLDTFPLPA